MGYVGKGLGSQPAMHKCWVRNRQCTRLSAMCCTYTQHTNAQHKHTHHTSVRASKHAYLYAHTCMQHTYAIMHTYMHTCIPSHDACRVRLLVLPIDDTDSANSACPKPRRAKSCRQPSSNQKSFAACKCHIAVASSKPLLTRRQPRPSHQVRPIRILHGKDSPDTKDGTKQAKKPEHTKQHGDTNTDLCFTCDRATPSHTHHKSYSCNGAKH